MPKPDTIAHADNSVPDNTVPDNKVPDTAPAGMWLEAWRRLRRRPLFWISVFIILLVLLVAAFPVCSPTWTPTRAT